MESSDDYDSPAEDRNPSPPPELAQNSDLISAECIGDTAFSKHWLFTTLIKLIEEVDQENAGPDRGSGDGRGELVVDVDDDLQNELCKLWDMSMNSDVAKFLDEFKAVEIMTGIIQKSKAPRVIEICVGVLGNMACEQPICDRMAQDHKFIELMLSMMETRDTPTLVENTRLVSTCLANTGSRGPWVSAIQRSEDIIGHLTFILSSSTNCDLLKNTAELVDTLLDLEPDLCISWATIDFVHALMEATEQIGSGHTDALEVSLRIFQSFSTTESGVEALVAHTAALELKVLKYLNIVCEYEIVGVDGKVRPLASALSVLNILFSSRPPAANSHICNDERFMRILLKILEPVYPMLQKYREAVRSHHPDSKNHVTPSNQSNTVKATADQSETKKTPHDAGDADNKNKSAEENKEAENGLDETEQAELKELSVLYEILSGMILDYCKIAFVESSKTDHEDTTQQEGENNSNTDNGQNTENQHTDTSNDMPSTSDIVNQGEQSQQRSKGDNPVINCVPILTYLDEACSRGRLNNFGLTLKETEDGQSLFTRLQNLASQHKKERLSRILNDIDNCRIVKRADSAKHLLNENGS
ncbi:protein saal1-like [Mya arenaria]|uniref:protein saal1-like n=1 Tax=Mya arenaria TaxID=6604 RepID=UPI0022E54326|nr:protein saal1-like [Mya arenaria]XP_052798653.1 protein saal1-like [Mya arenaria]